MSSLWKVAEATGSELIAYFQHLLALRAKGDASGADPIAILEILLRNRLKLVEGPAVARIKAYCLADADTLAHIEAHLDRYTFTFLLICLIILATAAHPAKERYVELIEERFRLLFQRGREGSDTLGLATVGTGFFALARNAPAILETVQTESMGPNASCASSSPTAPCTSCSTSSGAPHPASGRRCWGSSTGLLLENWWTRLSPPGAP
jgi:hypothetical protein